MVLNTYQDRHAKLRGTLMSKEMLVFSESQNCLSIFPSHFLPIFLGGMRNSVCLKQLNWWRRHGSYIFEMCSLEVSV